MQATSRILTRALGLAALLVLSALSPRASAQASVAEAAEAARPAVAHVAVMFKQVRTGRGRPGTQRGDVRVERPSSGVLLSSSGLLLTNDHLVAEVAEDEKEEYWLRVTLDDGREFPAEVVARDARLDLALLQLELDAGASVPALPLARIAKEKRPGERVVALSHHDGKMHHAFAGALAFPAGPVRLRDADLGTDEVLISDARFHHLLDGGPLIDSRGRVAGIHNTVHIRPLPPSEEEREAADYVNYDYAVVVSADAVRAAFAKQLEGLESPQPPLARRTEDVVPGAVATISPCIVSVWAPSEGEAPPVPDPADPHAQRIPRTLASGVVVDPVGLVLTSADLFEAGAETVRVRLASGEEYPGVLLDRKRSRRLAFVRLELPEGKRLQAATLSDSDEALQGEVVAVVGRPFPEQLTLSAGVLSALERGNFTQVASWVHAGHYGGALVDRYGRLLGIAVRPPAGAHGADEESYLGFAAPITSIHRWFAKDWKAQVEGGEPAALKSYTAAEREARTGAVARVVERLRGKLISVHVSEAVEVESKGFDPFGGEPQRAWRGLGQGSGVVIDASGLALSNWHVVDAAMNSSGQQSDKHLVEVRFSDGQSYVAKVLSTSRDDDLALLAIQLRPGQKLTPVELGDSDAIQVGASVVAIGNPHGLADSVSAGVLSTTGYEGRIKGRVRIYYDMLVTDAAINPGNSGGALLDDEGRLVGINSAGSTGWGMAIPVNKAREVFSDKLLSVDKLQSSYLGLSVGDEHGELLVEDVDPSGPAARARIEEDDILLRLAGEELTSAVAFAQLCLRVEPGVAIPVVVERGGDELELEIVPLEFGTWRISRQCGLELVPVDYKLESELVQRAWIDLHRAYTGNPESTPRELMGGALRVVRSEPIGAEDSQVRVGDLFLGMNLVLYEDGLEQQQLVRFQDIAGLREVLGPRATIDGETCECWFWRDGEVLEIPVFARRPR